MLESRGRTLTMVLVVLAVAVPLLFGSPAQAQEVDAEVFGVLKYEDAETEEDVFVSGIEVEVSNEGGVIGTVATDTDGRFAVAVTSNGSYTVTLDEDTLPEGVNLRSVDNNPLEISVTDGEDRRVLFPLVEGEGGSSGGSAGVSLRRVSQLTAEGLKLGLYLAMAAIGLSLIFGTTGLVNFAHAELITFGMLTTYMFNFYGLAALIGFLAPLPPPLGGGVNLLLAGVLGMLAGAGLGYLLNRFIFKGARNAGVSLTAQLVMTIGLSILLRYSMLYLFRGGPRSFGDFAAQRAIQLGPVQLTPKDLVAMALSVVILVGVGSYLQMTRMGKAMRAVADNRELAESTGIDVERVITLVWVMGGGLAALSGVFFGLDQVKWDFGFRILLLVFAAVTLGGLGTAYGALIGSLIVGLTLNLSTLLIDAEVKNMVAFFMLAVILLFRPHGILGRPERVG